MMLRQETQRFAALPRLLLCSDFDGTLAPIQPHPERVELSPAVRRLLWNLSRLPETSVAIVSGRSLLDIRQKIDLSQLWYIGNHGLEIMGPDTSYLHPELDGLRPALGRWIYLLRTRTSGIAGIYLEDKQYTASVHYRLVKPELRAKIESIVHETCPATFEVRAGKMVWELRPRVEWHKGWGIDWLAQRIDAPIIYLGDDSTDEDAFSKLGPAALTIKVGVHPTSARFLLRSVNAALEWLSDFFEARREVLGANALSPTPSLSHT